MKDLLIIGAGGLGRETAWLVERINQRKQLWNVIGFIDDKEETWGKIVNGYKVIGNCEKITEYSNAYVICAIGASKTREHIIHKVKHLVPDIKFATLIDPKVEMSDYVSIGDGSIICAGTVISVNVTIGKNVIVDWNCTIGHDAVLEDNVMLYPSVNVSGSTRIGTGVELGTGTQIIQGKKIGKYSIIGAGAVVVSDIQEQCVAVGVPAKPIKFFT
ncbi:MAG: acetyltransferase [Lachnospiraceae bacterium]|nr:acetyltransferase [Lachnospiraceae bacterium]